MTEEIRESGVVARRWAGPFLGVAVGAAMLVWTWGTWPDVLVDFGGELYVPWRLSEGDVLYRDVAYFTGPLSPYWNAAVFRIFGASLLTLVIANLAVLAGIAALLHRLVAKIAGPLAAGAALVVFLALFAFAQLESIGNSNYVCPYSHETTHGALLALASFFVLDRWLERRRTVSAAALGFLTGLAFLTKVEVFLAIAAACLLGLFLGLRADRAAWARFVSAFFALALLPVLLAFGALATAMPAAAAFRGTLGAWPYTIGGPVTDLLFYRWVLGTDHPLENLGKLAVAAGEWILVLGPAAGVAFFFRGRAGRGRLPGAIAGAVAILMLLFAMQPSAGTWIGIGRALPLFATLLLLPPFLACCTGKIEAVARPRAILSAAFALYALVLLLKMILHARINMYGFALAMPAVMLVVAALVGWIPAWIERAGGSGVIFKGFALGTLGVAVFAHLVVMQAFLSRKTVIVGEGKDAFRADARGTFVNAAVHGVREKLPPAGTLVVVPEGVMINFLARAKAPSRYINYMPPEVLMFGEDQILSDFERTPPDLVAIVHKSTAEYGLPWFGVDYGAQLMAFVLRGYTPWRLFGGEPLRPETRFGIRLLERRKSSG